MVEIYFRQQQPIFTIWAKVIIQSKIEKKNKSYFISTKNRNSKFNSLSFTANTIYTYLAIIGFSNIYILPAYRFLVWTGFYVGKIHPGHLLS